ncbi:hypothetical protein F5J12DRAFT_519559 [Pisolithus orientalis]|uniref:uncharacterized protein n=1 Tax=Pisolithus orientalis TaxID=936130 RepID=UPI002224C7A5|nr:uncharacterized protein F5J12DRAFT_519559 [Pisolithus orientalis]KAI6015155.1 hypothetical protein F5J12DRAFT_519559 [Pisolithus orientalis]
MADLQDSTAPRRSQRDRKQVKHFVSTSQSPSKRKRADIENELMDLSELDDADKVQDEDEEDSVAGDESDDEPEFSAPVTKQKLPAATRKGNVKARGPPPPKKPKTIKSVGTRATKVKKGPRLKAHKPKAANGDFDIAKLTTEANISTDNPLFNAILNPSAALQSTAEDFLDALSRDSGPAQAQLINCILRACGCNDSVDADQVVDYDGVVDTLDTFTEGLKQENSPTYPLTSKLPAFKRFRASLSELIERIVLAAAELGTLYTSDLMTTLQTWVVAMSSSQIRSFRHTATVVALELETALSQVAAAVEKEAEILGRQREGERKRKASNKASGVREKDLEDKVAAVRKRRAALAEYLKEIVDGVFVHRYRDLDPNIRAECVKALGAWFTYYPAHFLDTSYLRYVGWVLSDLSTPVRMEAARALNAVYAQSEYVSSLTHFTERFKPRLLEIAGGDTELGVRTAVISVLSAIDGHGLLEDEERERVCLLVFDTEARVRRAIAVFVAGVWAELVEERMAATTSKGKSKASDKVKARVGVKVLAMLLVKWGKALDRTSESMEEESVLSGESGVVTRQRVHPPYMTGADPRSRIALAVEALWGEVDAVGDWEEILEVLLLDHSAGGKDDDIDGPDSLVESASNTVDPSWRLEEVEESVLLEVLVASLRRAKAVAASGKKGEEEAVTSDVTRALMKGLPRLFIKYQTDEKRISDVLSIPPLMNLDLYLEMRMINAYAALWDDVIKQFLSHSSQTVLTRAVSTIRHLLSATSLANTNNTKILELEDDLASQLRDAVAGREEIEVASFNEDEVIALAAVCTRMCVLAGSRDLSSWMEEDEGGKQSSAWDIVSALVERGRLGYKEEERMIEQGLHLLGLHIMWKARGLLDAKNEAADNKKLRETLRVQRDSLLERLIEYAIGTQSNTAEGVKRAAFQNLMNLYILFCPTLAAAEDGQRLPTEVLALQLDDEVQYRCAGFIQATIEQYAELLEDERPAEELTEKDDSSDDQEDVRPVKNVKSKDRRKTQSKTPERSQPASKAPLEQEYQFVATISPFLRAIRAGAVHVRHGAVLLAHYGRLGPVFDLCTKVIVDVLRDEGMYNDNGEVVVDVVTRALKESFGLLLDSVVRNEDCSVGLAKQLASTFMIRGAQLAVVRKLDSQCIVKMHTTLLTWIIKRISTLDANKNMKQKGNALLFFKVLAALLKSVESRDALSIKAHMDQSFAQCKIEIPPASKLWEPQRMYEKRLNSILTKGKGGKGRKAKGATGVTDSEESEPEPQLEPRFEVEPVEDAAPSSRPRPRRRPVRRSPSPTEQSEHEVPPSVSQEDETQATPRGKPQPGNRETESPVKTPMNSRTTMEVAIPTNGNEWTRKRRRSEEMEVEESETAGERQSIEDVGVEEETSQAQNTMNEFIIRRKRARL